MNMKPILFNTEMVRAILDGRKTVTRRVVPERVREKWLEYEEWAFDQIAGFEAAGVTDIEMSTKAEFYENRSPYRKGDILYVRETWKQAMRDPAGGGYALQDFYLYKADGPIDMQGVLAEGFWRPPIHMPKDAARIFLRVTDVRVERLQDCGKGWCIDIEREGICTPQNPILYISDDAYHDALRAEMAKDWDSTIKPKDRDKYGWEANPWVWVIDFEMIDGEI